MLKGRQTVCDGGASINERGGIDICHPFRAALDNGVSLGSKPQAQSFSPFGAEAQQFAFRLLANHHRYLPPVEGSQPATRVQFGQDATLQHSARPKFEDENEALTAVLNQGTFDARTATFSIVGGWASNSGAFCIKASATRPERCASRPASSPNVSKIPKVDGPSLSANQVVVPGSSWTIDNPACRNCSNSVSLPAFASKRTSNANFGSGFMRKGTRNPISFQTANGSAFRSIGASRYRTPNAKRRTPNAKRQTPNAKRQTPPPHSPTILTNTRFLRLPSNSP
jgi:hypothetical protein